MSNNEVPNPGSDEAIRQGCVCPVLDNGHGDEELGNTRGFWTVGDCPLHNIAMREPPEPEKQDSSYEKKESKSYNLYLVSKAYPNGKTVHIAASSIASAAARFLEEYGFEPDEITKETKVILAD